MGFLLTILLILFVLVCLLLIFMVIITPSGEGGLASAFGGMGGDSFFGTKAHRHVNRFTVFLAVAFLVLAICINYLGGRQGRTKSGVATPPPATEPASTEEQPKNE